MKILFLVTAIAFIVVIVNAAAEEKVTNNKNVTTTITTTKTKDARGKRNLNYHGNFGANRREDGYSYPNEGRYNYDPSNYISGGSAPNYNHHYPEAPEPIIEIIIQENNETLPAPQPIIQHSSGGKKKEQVQVFYVKYHKDEKKGLVIHEPVAALSPAGLEQREEEESHHHDEPIIVTPIPNLPKTTIRTIIRPESEQYESSNGVHVTFNQPHNHHSKSDNQIHHDEVKVESAIQPVIQLPQSRIGPLPVISLKEKRAQPFPLPPPAQITQGRVVNSQPQQHGNFHHPPQPLVQSLPYQRPHVDFNPQNNFISQQSLVQNQLTLPSQEPSKPFHTQFNHHIHQQSHQQNIQHNIRTQQPISIPINHQHNQFNQQQQQQQGILAHQQFNQPPQRLPAPQLPQLTQNQQQQQVLLKPPQRQQSVSANFNQNQRPFNYHAHANQPPQVRFPSQQQQQQQQTFQRPQQVLPNRQGPPSANFHNQNHQQLPHNRPPLQFNPSPQFPPPQPPQSQQFPPGQGPPLSFKPEIKTHQTQSLHQHNQFAVQQNAIHQNIIQQQQQQNHNIFQGGLVEQAAPNLAGTRPHFTKPEPTIQSQEDSHFHQQNHQFIQSNFGSDIQVSSSVPKFEHHITETVNPPVFYQPTAVDMEKNTHDSNIGPLAGHIGHLAVTAQPQTIAPETHHHHRFSVGPQPNHHLQQLQQHQQQHQGSVSNHFSHVFPQINNQQKQFSSSNFIELNGRNNFISESRGPSSSASPSTTTSAATRKYVSSTTATTTTTTTEKPQVSSTSQKPKAYFDLPDEVPDDLRKQLEESGVLDNAQISILDYDKIGDTSLQDLPPEHLANFFSAGGGAQIGASNKVISVLKPNGDKVDDRIGALHSNKDVAKLLSNAGKLASKKEDVNLRVVKFDSKSEKNIPEQYIQHDAQILPMVNLQQNYSRYLPIKISSANFPIPDAEELRGKKISSVVVLAPVDQQDEEEVNDDGRNDRDAFEKKIKFLTGEILKNLIKKPSADNFKKWLEKEKKTDPELQSVVLLVARDISTNEQEIFMYDIPSKSVNKLSGELSSKFVNVAEENSVAGEESGTLLKEQIDRSDTHIEEYEEEDYVEAEPSNIVESVVSLNTKPEKTEAENKVLISSGYSVIKNDDLMLQGN